ncbi:MAG: hypothetical protein P1P90_04200 [Patescibacteria group bacterium]|nr:hypothetical protein [Patescibacteria group bacterium]
MENLEALKSVLEANRQVLQRARELNMRAGVEIFPILTATDLMPLVKECLAGARCAGEVQNVECLRLPPLDEAQEAEVLATAPDTLMVLVRERSVFYQKGAHPQVEIPQEEVETYSWKDLPDEGIFLPDGREVCIFVHLDYWNSERDTDLVSLKARLRDKANVLQWSRFVDKPQITLPDPMDPNSHVQRVKALQYGTCVVTGEPLMGYGVARQRTSRYFSSDAYFEVYWTRDEEEAERFHSEAVAYLDLVREQKREELERKQKIAEARTLQGELRDLEMKCSGDALIPKSLRDRLCSLAYEIVDEYSAARYAVKAEQLKLEVEAAFVNSEQKRVAERKAQEVAEARNLEAYGITGGLLNVAKAIAERALERHSSSAEDILMDELTAPYGRERRQQAIKGRLGNGGATSDFYSLSKARDVDAVLEAAIKLVNEQRIAKAVNKASSNKPQTPADPKKFDMGQLFGGVAKEAKKRAGKKSHKSSKSR